MDGQNPGELREDATEAPEPLGRAWAGPALLLAGLLGLGRVEVLTRLAVGGRGADPDWARWGVLAEWPAPLVQGLMMAAAAAALIWSARGGRRPLGIVLGAALCFSALTGWPVAPPQEISFGGLPGLPPTWLLATGCLAAAALVGFLAWLAQRVEALQRLGSATATLVLCALVGLVAPGWILWQASRDAPRMRVGGHELLRTRAGREAPNLVLVAIDALRSDRVSSYGYWKPTTPNLDQLARRGLSFEHAFATSSAAAPAAASLLTGLAPQEHGATSADAELEEALLTLAEALQERGFSTAAVLGSPDLNRERGFAQGFEVFDASAQRRAATELWTATERQLRRLAGARFFLFVQLSDPSAPRRPLASELERLGGEEPEDFAAQGGAQAAFEHYAARLRGGEGRDVMGAPHPEALVPPEHARWFSDQYDASVATADLFLGRLLQRLEALDLAPTTVVAVVGTHGEELFDHGLLGHGHGLWREQVQVPLVLAGPKIPSGLRLPQELSTRHLASTLARLGGAQLGRAEEALDLLDLDFVPERVMTYASHGWWKGEEGLELLGLRGEDYSLLLAPRGTPWARAAAQGGDRALFTSEADPGEQIDLAEEEGYRPIAESWSAELRRRDGELRARAVARTTGREQSP
jgi:hypothetical protein